MTKTMGGFYDSDVNGNYYFMIGDYGWEPTRESDLQYGRKSRKLRFY